MLLNGSTYMLSITRLPGRVTELARKEIVEALLKRYARLMPIRRKTLQVFGGAFSFFAKPHEGYDFSMVRPIMSQVELDRSIQKILDFVERNEDKTPNEIFQKYTIFHFGSKSNSGSFESLQGRRKSYSVYYPFLLDDILAWGPSLMNERRLFEHTITTKFPELAKIPGQNYRPPLYYRKKKAAVWKVRSYLDFMLRGAGVMRYHRWVRKRDYVRFARKVLREDGTFFWKIFDPRELMNIRKKHWQLFDNLLKIKQLLDIIETKGYRNFVSSE